MFSVAKLRRRPRQFARLVGLSCDEFDTLLAAVRVVDDQQTQARALARTRVRAVGGGRCLQLSLEERLLATLLYYRLHLTGLLLSCLFDLDESNLWRDRTERLRPALAAVLPTPMRDHLFSALEVPPPGRTPEGCSPAADPHPQPRQRIGTLRELLEAYPELRDLCVDATEQEVPKPQTKRTSRLFYSGKSHCHTVKTQLTTAGRLVLHLFGQCPGSVADRQLLKASGVVRAIAAAPVLRSVRPGHPPASPPEPEARRVRLDRGYSGLEALYDDLPTVQVRAALKGTSRTKVTALGRAWNHVMVSRQRIQIEQNIGHLKNWRVLSGLYRARVATHESTVAVVAGLHNYRLIGSLQWAK